MTAVDWSAVDWHDADADDPSRFVKGFRDWRYYAQPVYVRDDGVRFQPREFRAPTIEAAQRIIAHSPSGVGHVQAWQERTHSRALVGGVFAEKIA